jgi:capsular exopolysaccharide synthesis family protein
MDMGRVYKALVKAEQFQDTARPIGRPERSRADVRAPQGFSRNLSPAATSPVVFDDGFNPAEGRGVSANIRDLAIDPHVAALAGADTVASERCRALAVKLLTLTDRRKIKTLLITSAQAGDGKTTIATGVAWTLAKGAERRVLLIDAGLGSSSIGRMLGIEPKRGWQNVLDRSSELNEAIIRVEPNGLYLLTAGAASALPPVNHSATRLEDLIAELAPRFDLVIVDSGSILDSSDAQRLASVLDGVVIVARANHTDREKANAARKLVPKERRLGVVLNESESRPEIALQATLGIVGRLFGRKR